MATLVQQTAELFADNTSSIAPSITGVTAGNTVVMLVACSQSGTNTALTAPAGWSTAISTTGPTTNTYRQQVAVFYKENASSGSHSGTVTFANNSFAAAIICEFSGLKTSGAYDTANSQNGTATTSASTNSATNTDANALVLAVLCVSSDAGVVTGLSTPASSGYTNINGELDETAHTAYQFSYKNVSSSASQSGSWTWTNNGQYGAAVVIFSDAPATPVITAQPTDQTVNNGATATFSVTATGATSYQWQDNSSGSFADISGATSSSYVTSAATYSMQGRLYRCVVTNAGGSTNSNSAQLRVAFNLTGTGPRAYPALGGVIGAGSVESWLRGAASSGSSFEHIASGGFSFSGAAAAEQARNFTFGPSGGLTFGGAAAAVEANDYAATGSGGFTFGGTAAAQIDVGFTFNGSGGITFGGAASAVEANDYTHTPSGGVTLAGAATVEEANDYTASASGGIVFGGSATTSLDVGFVVTGTGGITFSGAAVTAESNDYAVTSSGGFLFGGSAVAEGPAAPSGGGDIDRSFWIRRRGR